MTILRWLLMALGLAKAERAGEAAQKTADHVAQLETDNEAVGRAAAAAARAPADDGALRARVDRGI